MTISVVIPTRNRPTHLVRALAAVARQTRRPDEVLVVDASDAPFDPTSAPLPGLPVACLHSRPGVCRQRNAGIRRARGTHVLLLDDDIEIPDDYIERLAAFLATRPDEGAATGLWREASTPEADALEFSTPSVRHLAFAFVFQLTVWADVESAHGRGGAALALSALRRWYRRRANRWTLAGWPLVTHPRGDVIHVAVYTLGAALVRRDWLLASPYEERLGPHGHGDNYGVVLGFPGDRPVAVLTGLRATHHRAEENRLAPTRAYLDRVIALDYFLRTHGRFRPTARAWLAWSLAGSALAFAVRRRRDLARQALRALGIVASGRNPLLTGAPPSPVRASAP